MIACGAVALVLAGGMGVGVAVLLSAVLVTAWKLEGTRWQLSERSGLIITILLALPFFYIDWKFLEDFADAKGSGPAGVGALVHLTVFLISVKLLQVKTDRDWLFIYLISFFQILLAAGLSFSPVFIATLSLYVLCALLTVICFELRKASREVRAGETRLLIARDATLLKPPPKLRARGKLIELRRLPVAALCLFILIVVLALPIFFVTPRFGESRATAAGEGTTGYVGFSDKMTLGDIGRLQKNDRVVLRVRIDEPLAERNQNLRWRGVALDRFDGRAWHRSSDERIVMEGSDRDFYQLGTTEGLHRLTTQTFFIEPIDTPVLFVAPRAVALQGPLGLISRDSEGALSARGNLQQRISYRAYSDTVEPPVEYLRNDLLAYPRDLMPYSRTTFDRYLQFPAELDPRIGLLAREIISRRGTRNRYDAARAIEAYLSGSFGYTLEMRAGGKDPLADFLFRVRAGHCEYFSTAMAVMLRTQGIAARVINGFQMGEYNSAANAYTVRQHDAHSWVEVYFPATDAWVSFDPTPIEGRPGSAAANRLRAQLNRYTEAFELFWIQYVVAYDKQEQRSLAISWRNQLFMFRQTLAQIVVALKSKLMSLELPMTAGRTGTGIVSLSYVLVLLPACALIVTVVLLTIVRVRRKTLRLTDASASLPGGASAISFYERMAKVLDAHGIRRASDQTPMEFASATGIPEVLHLTRAYHRVRYGDERLSPSEVSEIERLLQRVKEGRT